ncbi:uncharacterized protein LOC129980744, partial [Argiope bruennichi]|uniref:uncharacterized protein LOC129980744 n=1 Tax=Argiope bruennichi TaxID=94029 RepID=UPI0024957E83
WKEKDKKRGSKEKENFVNVEKLYLRDKARNKNYGPSTEKTDLSEQEFRQKREQIIKSFQLSDTEVAALERATIEQKDSSLWREERRKRLTASDFGVVCCRKESISCENIIKNKLYSHFLFAAMKCGQENELNAIRALEENFNLKIQCCSLFVNTDFAYIATSPDGLIGDDGIVEVKCPASCKNISPDEAIKFPFWKLNKDGKTTVNKNHKYYFQVLGQLHIT